MQKDRSFDQFSLDDDYSLRVNISYWRLGKFHLCFPVTHTILNFAQDEWSPVFNNDTSETTSCNQGIRIQDVKSNILSLTISVISPCTAPSGKQKGCNASVQEPIQLSSI